jgi:hypothetical protein
MAEATENGQLWYQLRVDTDRMHADLERSKADFRNLSRDVSQEGRKMDEMFRNLGRTAAGMFTVGSAMGFVKQAVSVRGEIEMMEKSFEVLTGSIEKSNKMLYELKNIAVKSPLELSDISKAAQTLMSFNIDAEKVIPTIKQLSDISMGEAGKFNSLALAFAQMSSTGKLMGQDLMQMINAGFNPLNEISQKTGKSISVLKDEMTKGAISSEMVADAFRSATAEGGKFYGMTEKQAEGLAGLQASMSDALTTMMNKIGKSSQGTISEGLKLATTLVENYEKVGREIVALIGTYGVYKAALMSIVAMQRLNSAVLRQAVLEKKLAAAAGIQLSNAEAIAAARTKALAIAQQGLVKSLRAVSAAMMANPYALVAAAVAALGYAIYKLATYQSDLEKSQKRLNELNREYTKSAEAERVQIDILFGRLKNATEGTEKYGQAKKAIIDQYGGYLKGLSAEIQSLQDVAGAYRAVSAAAIQSAKDRTIATGTQQASDTYAEAYSESMKEIRDKFIKKFGEAQGELLLEGLKESLDSGKLTKEVEAAISSFDRTRYSANGTGAMSLSSVNDIRSYIGRISYAKGILEKEIKEIEGIYGKAAKVDGKSTEGVTEYVEIGKEAAKARESVARLKAEIADLRSGKTKVEAGTSLTDEIEGKLKELKEAEDNLALLTGVSKSDAGKAAGKAEREAKRAAKEEDRLARLAADAEEKINDIAGKAALERQRIALDNEERLLAIEEDGAEKRRIQIDLDYQKELLKIKENERSLVQAQQDMERRQWEQGGKKGVFSPKTTSVSQLSEEQRTDIEALYDIAEKEHKAHIAKLVKEEKDAQAQAMTEYLIEYGNYGQKRLAITEKYAKLIEKATTDGERLKFGKDRDRELKDLEKRMGAQKKVWTVLMGNLGGLTRQMLEDYISKAEEIVKNAEDSASEETQNMVETIEKARQFLAEKNPFTAMRDALKDYKKAVSDSNAEDAQKYWQKFSSAADEAQSTINSITSSLGNMGGLVSDDLQQAIETVGGVVSGVSGAMKAFGKESASAGDKIAAISGIVAAATSAIGDFVNALEEASNASYEMEMYQKRFADSYFLMMQKIKDSDYDGIFGTDSIGKAINAYDSMIKVQERYSESLQKTDGSTKRNTASMDLWGKEVHKQNELRRKAMEDGYNEIQSMTLMVSEANFWQKLVGKGSRYTTLKDIAPELWDSDGMFNVDAARIFLETNDTINKENNRAQREAIENLIALKDAEEELLAIVDAQLESIFGHLSGDITDAIFDSVRNGADAWDLFEDAGLKVIDTLGKQMIKEMFIQAYLDTFLDRMRNAYSLGSIEETQKELGNIMNDIFKELGTAVNGATQAAKDWDAWAAANGWDINKLTDDGSGREAAAKGIAGLTQDTGEELKGRITAMQYILSDLNGSVKMLQSNSAQALRHLSGIEINTARLEAIESGIRSIGAGIQDIGIKGVKLRV